MKVRRKKLGSIVYFIFLAFTFISCGVGGGGGGGTASPPPTGIPQNVTATPGDRLVTITWSPVFGATSYNLYWSATSGVTKITGTKITGVSSPYGHGGGLTNGTTYYYVVTAIALGGEGAESAQVSATPSAGVNTSGLWDTSSWDNATWGL